MKSSYRRIILKNSSEKYRAGKFIEEVCDYNNISDEYFGNIMLAITEAVEILFSFGEEFDSSVNLSYERVPSGLQFKLTLSGIPVAVTDDEEEFLKDNVRKHSLGRELYIIKSLTDRLTIHPERWQIILNFYVSSLNQEKSLQRAEKLKMFLKNEQTVMHH